MDGGLTQLPAGKGKPRKTGVCHKGSLTVIRKLSKTGVLDYLWFFILNIFTLALVLNFVFLTSEFQLPILEL